MTRATLKDVAKERRETISSGYSGLPIVGLEHLIPQQIQLTEWSENQENTFTKLFKKGDMLFGRRRAYLKKAALAQFDGICSGDITVISPISDKILPDLLPFIIQNDDFFAYAVEKSAGSLSPRVKWEALKDYEFELPDMATQKKLAEILWAAEETKQSYKKLLQKTDDMVKAKFVEMFGSCKNSPNKVSFEDAFIIRDDLRKPLNDSERSEMYKGMLYPYYGANGQVDSINKYLTDCTILCLAEDCGSYGPGEPSSYIVSGKAWVNNHAHVLLMKDTCNIKYANIYFTILDMRQYVTGTTRLKLTQGKMKEIPIILPPIEQQNKFVEFAEQAEQSKQKLQKSLDDLNLMNKSIINEHLK